LILFILGGHLFHQNCLRSWLEQDTTCPICRLSLHEDNTQSNWSVLANTQNLIANNGQRRNRNHLFRFNGNRYSSWLPSFSIEINHNFPFRLGRARLNDVQLTSMAQSVQQIFPHIPFEVIRSDLQQTQSIDTTIENFIERQTHLEPQQSGSEESLSDTEEPFQTDLL
jgi:autocrine motility factor receptor